MRKRGSCSTTIAIRIITQTREELQLIQQANSTGVGVGDATAGNDGESGMGEGSVLLPDSQKPSVGKGAGDVAAGAPDDFAAQHSRMAWVCRKKRLSF